MEDLVVVAIVVVVAADMQAEDMETGIQTGLPEMGIQEKVLDLIPNLVTPQESRTCVRRNRRNFSNGWMNLVSNSFLMVFRGLTAYQNARLMLRSVKRKRLRGRKR